MKTQTLVVALSLAWGIQPALAGTVDFSAVGYGQYGNAQSYPLPIANYQFGYDMDGGPFTFVTAPDASRSPLIIDLSKNPITRLHGTGNPYPELSGGDGSTPTTKDGSLLPVKFFPKNDKKSVSHNRINAAEIDYPSATPSIKAWAKEWPTDTDGGMVDNSSLPKGVEPFPFSQRGFVGQPDNMGLVAIGGGISSHVARSDGNVILAAYGEGRGSSSISPSGTPGSVSQSPGENSSGSGPSTGTYIDPEDPDNHSENGTLPPPSGQGPNTPGGPGNPDGPDNPNGPGNPGGTGSPNPGNPGSSGNLGNPAGSRNEVPEPATLLLFGSALLGMSVLRRRSNRE